MNYNNYFSQNVRVQKNNNKLNFHFHPQKKLWKQKNKVLITLFFHFYYFSFFQTGVKIRKFSYKTSMQKKLHTLFNGYASGLCRRFGYRRRVV